MGHMEPPWSTPTTLCCLLATQVSHRAGKAERRSLNKCSFLFSPAQLVCKGHRYWQMFLEEAPGSPLGPAEHLAAASTCPVPAESIAAKFPLLERQHLALFFNAANSKSAVCCLDNAKHADFVHRESNKGLHRRYARWCD